MAAKKPPELTLEQKKKMCTGKRLFTTEGAAAFAARRSTKSFRKLCRYYVCPNCSWFHVTSQPL